MSGSAEQVLVTAGSTDVGRQRSDNQDAHGAWTDTSGRTLLVVADGLGGHQGGATASRIAVDTFRDVFTTEEAREGEALLAEAFMLANERIHAASLGDLQLRGMGTTAVALLLESRDGALRAWVAHVGDSRAYRLRAGEFVRLTLDHTLRAQLKALRGYDTARIDEEVAQPDALIRALGPEPQIDADVRSVSVEAGDRFLLCSDGLWGPVPDQETADILGRHGPADAADVLIDEANRRGGPDNVTLQIAALPPPEAAVTASELPLPAELSRGVFEDPARTAPGPPAASLVPVGGPDAGALELPPAPLPVPASSASEPIGVRAWRRLPLWSIPVAGLAALLIGVLLLALLLHAYLAEGGAVPSVENVSTAITPDEPDATSAGATAYAASAGSAGVPDEARAAFAAFLEARRSCDLAELLRVTAPALRADQKKRCAGQVTSGRLQVRTGSWRRMSAARASVEFVERLAGQDARFRAILEQVSSPTEPSARARSDRAQAQARTQARTQGWRVVSVERRGTP